VNNIKYQIVIAHNGDEPPKIWGDVCTCIDVLKVEENSVHCWEFDLSLLGKIRTFYDQW